MPTKKKNTSKKKPASKKKSIKIVTIKITKGKTKGGIEQGFCYEMKGCKGKKLSGNKTTKAICKSLKGKSWDGDKSGCVNL